MSERPVTLGAVVVGVDQRDAALALGARGATVIVVGADAEQVGELVREVADGGARASAFVGDPADPAVADALAEMLAELF